MGTTRVQHCLFPPFLEACLTDRVDKLAIDVATNGIGTISLVGSPCIENMDPDKGEDAETILPLFNGFPSSALPSLHLIANSDGDRRRKRGGEKYEMHAKEVMRCSVALAVQSAPSHTSPLDFIALSPSLCPRPAMRDMPSLQLVMTEMGYSTIGHIANFPFSRIPTTYQRGSQFAFQS